MGENFVLVKGTEAREPCNGSLTKAFRVQAEREVLLSLR